MVAQPLIILTGVRKYTNETITQSLQQRNTYIATDWLRHLVLQVGLRWCTTHISIPSPTHAAGSKLGTIVSVSRCTVGPAVFLCVEVVISEVCPTAKKRTRSVVSECQTTSLSTNI